MTTYWKNVGYLLEYEKIKKLILELLENQKIKNAFLNFWLLDVSTSEVCQQMTAYWKNVGYLLDYEKIKK